jgi:transposase
MAIADNRSLPVAVHVDAAASAEVRLVETTIAKRFVEATPKYLVADRAYDSDPLDKILAHRGVTLIAPHRGNRKHPTQDGRPLRRYQRRRKVERLLAWTQNFRRLITRYEYYAENFLAFVQLGCIIILLSQFYASFEIRVGEVH